MKHFAEPDENCFELVVGTNHVVFVVAGNPAVKNKQDVQKMVKHTIHPIVCRKSL